MHAQVSPGALSKSHASLDNPLKCTACHIFGAGAAKLKCLYCHTEIRALVRNHEGMHGRVANTAKGDTDCVRCHTEHYGVNFRIFKWDDSQEDFDHRKTGYPLEGRHAKLQCEQCHNPKHISAEDRKVIRVRDLTKTFEGLHPACLTCHEDHHAGQLGADCARCHTVARWKPVTTFDHSKTHFPLSGKHENVECAKCHRPLETNAKVTQYTGLAFASCSPCHQDPHRGAFAARCEQCHDTALPWKQVRSTSAFDHSKTKFPLAGKHGEVACLKCHKDANFKTPVAHARCLDCHEDQHKGQFAKRADGGECASCHTVSGWRPTTFNTAAHQSSRFPLLGKHRPVTCDKCHTPAKLDTNYHPAFQRCIDCHKDVHNAQFASAPHNNRCEDCHNVDGFTPATYTLQKHQSTQFALKGAHMAVSCQGCHRPADSAANPENPNAGWRFHFPNEACGSCHRDPHRGEFPAAIKTAAGAGHDVCESCHTTLRWQQVKSFDHNQTEFPITGGHQALSCLSCHRPVGSNAATREIPFKVPSRLCDGCHEDIHEGQFQEPGSGTDCARCHTTGRWVPVTFDHEKNSTFSLRGAHEKVPCRLCHIAHQNAAGRTIVRYKDTTRECKTCHQ